MLWPCLGQARSENDTCESAHPRTEDRGVNDTTEKRGDRQEED